MMPSLTCFNLRFTPNWLMGLLTLVFFSLFMKLGLWQLHRADEKAAMLESQQKLANQAAISWDDSQPLPKQYQPIQIKGTYLSHIFLLDNQHHQHQFGYNALSPLLLSNGKVILVDRGWVAADVTRIRVPEIEVPKGLINIEGAVYYPGKKQWLLGPGFEQKTQKTTIIELINTKILNQLLQKEIYPFIIRLNKEAPYGFVRDWAVVSMLPERHLAYAVQWFALALVILILFVVLNLKKK